MLYGRAGLGVYGSQMMWLGAWTFLDVDTVTYFGWEQGTHRSVLYVTVGLGALVLIDEFYAGLFV